MKRTQPTFYGPDPRRYIVECNGRYCRPQGAQTLHFLGRLMTDSPYEAHQFRDYVSARSLARKAGGCVLVFNPVTRTVTEISKDFSGR